MVAATHSSQKATAHTLYILGASLMLFGLCWGFVVPGTPFPRLGLTAHIQCMAVRMSRQIYQVVSHLQRQSLYRSQTTHQTNRSFLGGLHDSPRGHAHRQDRSRHAERDTGARRAVGHGAGVADDVDGSGECQVGN